MTSGPGRQPADPCRPPSDSSASSVRFTETSDDIEGVSVATEWPLEVSETVKTRSLLPFISYTELRSVETSHYRRCNRVLQNVLAHNKEKIILPTVGKITNSRAQTAHSAM